MNKCQSCKHWNLSLFQQRILKNEGILPGNAKCDKLSIAPPEQGILVDMQGIIEEIGWEGEESYDTGKDFGCIHFENK